MIIELDSLWNFTHYVYHENEIRKFVKFTEIVRDLLSRIDLSTHASLDRHIAQLCKLLYLSKKYRFNSSMKTLFDLYELRRLEEMVKTLNMFRNDVKRIRIYVYKSLMYYINEILNNILDTKLVYRTKVKYAEVTLEYEVREDIVGVDATYTVNGTKITSHFMIEAGELRERLVKAMKMKNYRIDTGEQILLNVVFRRIRDIVNKRQPSEIPAFSYGLSK